MQRTDVFINTKTVHSGAPRQTYSIIVSDQFYYEYYYGRRATLSIGDVLSLHGILEGAVVCNVEHHVSNRSTFAGSSRDYTIMISRNPDSGVSTGGVSHRRKATMNDRKTDNAQHPPVHLLLRRKRPLLDKGGRHHLIYVG